jgi:hypothetical protein
VAPLWSIDEWFDDWLARAAAEPFLYDNHLCPQSAIVPPDATVFRLEDGLDAIVPHLDLLAGNRDGPRAIPAENVRKKGMGPDAERPRRSPGWRSSTPRISPASAMARACPRNPPMPSRSPRASGRSSAP